MNLWQPLAMSHNVIRVSTCFLMIVVAAICGCESQTASQSRPALRDPIRDMRLSVVDVGGFRLGMTPAAALRVIQTRGYREDTLNQETLW